MTKRAPSIFLTFAAAFFVATASLAINECPDLRVVTIDLDAIRPSNDPIQFLLQAQWPYPEECKITHLELVGSKLSLDSAADNIDTLKIRFSSLSSRLARTPKISLRIPAIFHGTSEEIGSRANVLRLALKLDVLEVHGVTTPATSLNSTGQTKLLSAAVCGLLLKESLTEQDPSRKLRLSSSFAACSVTYGIVHLLRSSTSQYIQGGVNAAQCAIPSLVGLGGGSTLGNLVYPLMSGYCWFKNAFFPPSFGMQVCIRADKLHLQHHTTDAYLRNEFPTQGLSGYCQETIGS